MCNRPQGKGPKGRRRKIRRGRGQRVLLYPFQCMNPVRPGYAPSNLVYPLLFWSTRSVPSFPQRAFFFHGPFGVPAPQERDKKTRACPDGIRRAGTCPKRKDEQTVILRGGGLSRARLCLRDRGDSTVLHGVHGLRAPHPLSQYAANGGEIRVPRPRRKRHGEP